VSAAPRVLYCNCSYAQVVPKEVKAEVLRRLLESGVAFDAVADLCDMAARRDPALKKLAESGAVRIAACYPRAVKWLFHQSGAPLPKEGVEVLNMREESAQDVAGRLLANGEGKA
jgi:heterodisulfide reductase subunit A-like polyferredoxin